MRVSLKRKIANELGRLSPQQQVRVLDFIQVLKLKNSPPKSQKGGPGRKPKGTPGKMLLPFAGTIPRADLEAISRAIEKGCERVDVNAW